MRKKRSANKALTLRPVFHIFCEGEKTEPNYINRYKDLFCSGNASVKVEPTPKNTPVQLVQAAVQCRGSDSVSPLDKYWVVYDRESPGKYSEELHAKARNIAKDNGINIALSNVCFEVWLLLHKQKTCAACDTCAELLRRTDFKRAFKNYEKGSACTMTREEIVAARNNARKLNESTKRGSNREWTVPSKWNPYTDVYRLLDDIDEFLQNLDRKN